MKKIDYILQNFNSKFFLKDILKGGEGWCEDEILRNTKDINDIEYQLYYLKFFKGDINKKLKINAAKTSYTDTSFLAKKAILNFLKKKYQINKKNIEKYFIKKGILNLSSWGYDFSEEDDWDDDTYEIREVLKHYVDTGIFFQNIKEFSLIYNGQITFKTTGLYEYEIICFFSKTDNKYHLLLLFLEEDGNDSYEYIKTFRNKPNLNQIKLSIKKLQEQFPNSLLFYSMNEKNIKSYSIYNPPKKIRLDNYWSKNLKKGLNLERVDKPIFRDDDSFYKNFKDDGDIMLNYIKSNPSKYFSSQNASHIINKHFKEYPTQKFKKFKFFKYIMSENFNYKNDPKFLLEILHSKDDLEGLLSFVPKRTQENKKIAEEIRILKMLRTKDRKFLLKIFNTNKDKLHDLALFYMPKKIFDDPFLVMEMTKIDTNIIDLIGDKLKKNKKFMKKIWE